MDTSIDSSSDCSSYSGGPPPPGLGGGETAQDFELACPSIIEEGGLASSFRRQPSELRLDTTMTIEENTERTRRAEEALRSRANFAAPCGNAGDAVSVVMINGELYRYPDGKKLEPTVTDASPPKPTQPEDEPTPCPQQDAHDSK